jgi:nitrate reductase NapD
VAEQHVSSLVVHVRPDRVSTATAAIAALTGAEVHAATPEGKLVVTLETGGTDEIMQALSDINAIQGVLSAVLAFHQVEPE